MWRYGVWFVLLAAVGCQNLPRNAGAANSACPPDGATMDGCAPTDCAPPTAAAPCVPKPQVEVRSAEEVQVNVPRQRVIVPRRAAQTTAVEQQQVVQTRQVLLVPQQVLVPFIQTSTTGPIRVAGLQETQITNLATLTTAAASGVAVTQTTAGDTRTAVAAPTSTQSLADCQAQLRQCEERLKQMTAITESLAAQVQQLKSGANREPAK